MRRILYACYEIFFEGQASEAGSLKLDRFSLFLGKLGFIISLSLCSLTTKSEERFFF